VQASEEVQRATAIKEEAANQLIAAMGNASYAVAADGTRFSFKAQKRAGYTVEPKEIRVLRRLSR